MFSDMRHPLQFPEYTSFKGEMRGPVYFGIGTSGRIVRAEFIGYRKYIGGAALA
jgi:hypothetical protein